MLLTITGGLLLGSLGFKYGVRVRAAPWSILRGHPLQIPTLAAAEVCGLGALANRPVRGRNDTTHNRFSTLEALDDTQPPRKECKQIKPCPNWMNKWAMLQQTEGRLCGRKAL